MVRDRLNDLVGPIPNSFDPNTRSVVDLAVQRFEHLPHLWIIWIKFIEALGIVQRLDRFTSPIAKANQCGE